jgi:GntR family transcriptional regulator
VNAAILFHVQPASGVPIYRQLMDQVLRLAAGRRLPAGDFLPSVRQVAESLQINPMTVSKAYSLLERDGVVELVRGQGMRLLAPQARGGARERLDELRPLLAEVAARAHQLALEPAQVLQELGRHLQENRHG